MPHESCWCTCSTPYRIHKCIKLYYSRDHENEHDVIKETWYCETCKKDWWCYLTPVSAYWMGMKKVTEHYQELMKQYNIIEVEKNGD